MVQVDFYHLTATPLDRALPRIAERILAAGDRLLIVSASEEQRTAIDRLLWRYSPESFLPHGCAGTDADAVQPVLIAGDVAAANGARMIALVDGEWRDGALDFDRVFHFFGEDAIMAARAAWKGLAEREGVERRYWKQSERGGWEKAA
jgi:DNA polymerase-3 subunit chi